MVARPILTVPNSVLRKKSLRIKAVDTRILKLARDMIDTLQGAGGVGLAAPQLGVLVRLCIFSMPEKEPFALVNPEIIKCIGKREVTEGCLSIPGFQGRIMRSVTVTVKGLDLESRPMRLKATGLLAQALEHEIDHLNGVLYIDHLEGPDKLYKIMPGPDGLEAGNL